MEWKSGFLLCQSSIHVGPTPLHPHLNPSGEFRRRVGHKSTNMKNCCGEAPQNAKRQRCRLAITSRCDAYQDLVVL